MTEEKYNQNAPAHGRLVYWSTGFPVAREHPRNEQCTFGICQTLGIALTCGSTDERVASAVVPCRPLTVYCQCCSCSGPQTSGMQHDPDPSGPHRPRTPEGTVLCFKGRVLCLNAWHLAEGRRELGAQERSAPALGTTAPNPNLRLCRQTTGLDITATGCVSKSP